jgi:hypothetical protein
MSTVLDSKTQSDLDSDSSASTLIVINNNVSRQPPPARPTTTGSGDLTDYPSPPVSSVSPSSLSTSLASSPTVTSFESSLPTVQHYPTSIQPSLMADSDVLSISSHASDSNEPEAGSASLSNSSTHSEPSSFDANSEESVGNSGVTSGVNPSLGSADAKPSLYSPELHMRPYNNVGNGAPSSASSDSIQSASSENRLRWIDYRNRPAYPPRMPPVHGIPSGFRNPTASAPTLPNVAATATANSGILGPTISASPTNAAGPSSVNQSPPSSNGAAYLNNPMHSLALSPLTVAASQMSPNAINAMNNNLNFASIVNSLAVPNMHTPSFGGSSSNPVGFPYPNSNNMPVISNGLIPSVGASISTSAAELEAEIEAGLVSATHSFSRRPGMNITRVERKFSVVS